MSSLDDVRARWIRLRAQLDANARLSKVSQSAVIELSKRYRLLDSEQRSVVDALVAEWLLSDDESTRFDALALVDEHRIRSAVPTLKQLSERLEESSAPGAPYEWAKINRIIGNLGGAVDDQR